MTTVRARETVAVRTFPGITVVSEGDEYDSDHPLVKAHPSLFVADNIDTPEAATSNPGERRSAKRAARKAPAKSSD